MDQNFNQLLIAFSRPWADVDLLKSYLELPQAKINSLVTESIKFKTQFTVLSNLNKIGLASVPQVKILEVCMKLSNVYMDHLTSFNSVTPYPIALLKYFNVKLLLGREVSYFRHFLDADVMVPKGNLECSRKHLISKGWQHGFIDEDMAFVSKEPDRNCLLYTSPSPRDRG